MTDNEIIKALECCTSDKCTCSECSYEYTKHIKNEEFEVMSNGKSYDEWSCDEWLKCDLLDLINRQKSEIERLETENKEQDQAIINALHKMGQIRAEAVKEFAERLVYTLCINNEENTEMFDYAYTIETIDNLVKEFTE